MPNRETIVAAIETYFRVQTEKGQAGWTALFSEDGRIASVRGFYNLPGS